MKKFFIAAILFILFALAFFVWDNYKNSDNLKTLKINSSKIFIEIADSHQKRSQGLSGRPILPENQGMLFIFDQPDYYSFWMKGMLLPLDFVWISNKQVAETTQNVQPQDYQPPKTITPSQPVDAVLEINAGMVQKLNIKAGDKIEY